MTLQQLEKIIADHKRLSDAFASLGKAGLPIADSDIHRLAFTAVETLIDIVDPSGWIEWFIYDNEYGKRKMFAGQAGKMKQIKTARQLLAVMKYEEKSKP